jgi:hypothetical protein
MRWVLVLMLVVHGEATAKPPRTVCVVSLMGIRGDIPPGGIDGNWECGEVKGW